MQIDKPAYFFGGTGSSRVGYAADLLSNRDQQKPVQVLVNIVGMNPYKYRSKMVDGVHYAFSAWNNTGFESNPASDIRLNNQT